MHSVALANVHRPGLRMARSVMPMIVAAELCSWYAVLTTSNLGHVFEESLWGLCAAALISTLVFEWPRCSREFRPALAAAVAIGLSYVVYIFQVDVPMYWTRWVADAEQRRVPLTLMQGLIDASGRWTVTDRWTDWRPEVVWMSLYFSVAVWLSIGLIHLPCRLIPVLAGPKPLSPVAV
jgi:hypothetical protein